MNRFQTWPEAMKFSKSTWTLLVIPSKFTLDPICGRNCSCLVLNLLEPCFPDAFYSDCRTSLQGEAWSSQAEKALWAHLEVVPELPGCQHNACIPSCSAQERKKPEPFNVNASRGGAGRGGMFSWKRKALQPFRISNGILKAVEAAWRAAAPPGQPLFEHPAHNSSGPRSPKSCSHPSAGK
jgi:hypothetical protein